MSSFFVLSSSIAFTNSLEFKNTLFNPYCSAFLIISYIGTPVLFDSSSILSRLVFPIPLLGSFIILFKLKLSDGFCINLKYEIMSFISFLS